MTIHLIRHAHAGKRSEWLQDDELRPLSKRGIAQSRALTAVVGDLVVGRIMSSPCVRCLQTASPLAEKFSLPIESSDAFAEGADGADAYRILLALDEHDGVACSHGDVIPLLLRRLVADGMDTDGPLIDQKGSVWVIEMRNNRPFHGRYVPPPQ
ncbi:MAG: phosphoglycerate mutase family protein [Acidimicrobiales bacterium]